MENILFIELLSVEKFIHSQDKYIPHFNKDHLFIWIQNINKGQWLSNDFNINRQEHMRESGSTLQIMSFMTDIYYKIIIAAGLSNT